MPRDVRDEQREPAGVVDEVVEAVAADVRRREAPNSHRRLRRQVAPNRAADCAEPPAAKSISCSASFWRCRRLRCSAAYA